MAQSSPSRGPTSSPTSTAASSGRSPPTGRLRRPLTQGHLDSAPAFSPDGRWLGLPQRRAGRRAAGLTAADAGGCRRRLTDHHLGAGAPGLVPWTPRLTYDGPGPRGGAYPAPSRGRPRPEPSRLITTLQYRPGRRRLPDRPAGPGLRARPPADFADDTGRPGARPGDQGDADCTDVTWRPDGGELAFVSARHRVPTATWSATSTPFALDGAGLQPVTESKTARCRPTTRPAARCGVTAVPDLGPDGLDFVARQAGALPGGRRGGEPLEPLLDPRHHRGDETRRRSSPTAACSSGVQRRARSTCWVPLDGGAPESLVDGPFTVRGFAAAGGVVVACVAHDRSAGELIALTPVGAGC